MHAIIILRQHTQLYHIECGMPLSPLGSIHGWMASAVAFYHRPWKTYTIRLRRAWHAIIAIGKHTRLDNVQRRITSSPLGSTQSRTTSGVVYHHYPWTAHTVRRRLAWHAIINLGEHTLSDDVGRGMLLLPFDRTHNRTMFCAVCPQGP